MLVTLGNAIMATAEENNRLFADRPVNESKLSASTGLLNLFGASVGGIPMGHGAGGMAGHVVFDARPGGAPIILGVIPSRSRALPERLRSDALGILPKAIHGVILFLTGAQLALGSCDFSKHEGRGSIYDRTVPSFFHLKTPNFIRITPIRYRMILVGERI